MRDDVQGVKISYRMKKCHIVESSEYVAQMEILLAGNGISTIKKTPTLNDQEALAAYKEVLNHIAEIIANDIIKQRKRKADG